MVSKQKNRHIKLLFGVSIHAVALFVCRISIIKYRIKHRCHIIVSLVPALCWCDFFCWDTVVVTRFIQGRESLCWWRRGSQLPLWGRSGISATQWKSAKARLCKCKLIIAALNQEKCIVRRNLCEKRVSHWTCQQAPVCLQAIWCRMFDVCIGFEFSLQREITNSLHFILAS